MPWPTSGRTGTDSGGETPPGWLAGTDWPTWISGSSRVSTYKWHGVVFGLALVLVAGGLGRIVAGSKVQGRRQQRAWWLIVGGLGAVAVGSLLEYGISEDVLDAGYGFMLELLGFLSVMVGTITLGLAMRRERAFGRLHSAAIALIGPVGVVVGVAIVGHLPSGPASLLLIAAIAVGATGPPGTSRT